jgi:hypothetical protein
LFIVCFLVFLKKNFYWVVSEVFYLQFLKSSFWIKLFSSFGRFYYLNFDLGAFKYIEKGIFFYLNSLYTWVKRFFFKNLKIFILRLFLIYFIF